MVRGWSRRVPAEFSYFALLFTFGILLGNSFLLALSLVLLFFLVASLMYSIPQGIELQRERSHVTTFVGHKLKIGLRLKVDRGVGLVTITDAIPAPFKVREGNNLRVFFKGRKPLDESFSYELDCTKRGVYHIGKARMERLHFSGLEQTAFIKEEAETQVLVEQKLIDVKRLRNPRLAARLPMPRGSLARVGMETTDFREIREYHMGDHYRSINWKASVRFSALDRIPLVNEYEREGKKVVWIFLDSGKRMSIGSDAESAFERAVQAGWALSQFYLSRDCNVGVCDYHADSVVLPEMGKRQKSLLSKLFTDMQISKGSEPLSTSVRKYRGHIEGRNPLFIIITMLHQDNIDEIVAGIQEMKARSGYESKVLLLHINGYDLAATGDAERTASLLMSLKDLKLMNRVRKTGAALVTWNPNDRSLQNLMLLGMRGGGS